MKDFGQQPYLYKGTCPDEEVNLFTATPVDTFRTAKIAVEHVAKEAAENGIPC